jgi:hypothetical protein
MLWEARKESAKLASLVPQENLKNIKKVKTTKEKSPEIPEDEKFFWEPKFQRALKKSEKEYEEGETLGSFDNADDLCDALDS